jgi:two-component system sensor histidine kinase BaeS
MAAAVYLEAGGWSRDAVRTVATVARTRGDAVMVLDLAGRPVRGSRGVPAAGSVRAPVVVGGRRVGTVLANHADGQGVSATALRLHQRLAHRMHSLLARAAVVAGALALGLALALALRIARPLRRLTDVAARMEAGHIEVRATGAGGGREIVKLAETMDRLAAALRRQDELRRATAGDLGHELRGALVGVATRIEALRDGLLDDEQGTLAQVQGDTRRLHRLIDDVERLAEAQQPGLLVHKRPTDLAAIVRTGVQRHTDHARALSIALGCDVGPTVVLGDPERLSQVVDNLLSNALRYTDPGGRVVVRGGRSGSEALIEVADSGIGIAPEHLPRIYDRFWRAPAAAARAAAGSGVGLALVAMLVRAHDGRVEASSRPGHGSSFRVFLPLADGAPTPRPTRVPEADPATSTLPSPWDPRPPRPDAAV